MEKSEGKRQWWAHRKTDQTNGESTIGRFLGVWVEGRINQRSTFSILKIHINSRYKLWLKIFWSVLKSTRKHHWRRVIDAASSNTSFLAALGLCCFLCRLCLVVVRGGSRLCCSAWTVHCGGFSCCRAQSLSVQDSVFEMWASVVVTHRLSSCGTWA